MVKYLTWQLSQTITSSSLYFSVSSGAKTSSKFALCPASTSKTAGRIWKTPRSRQLGLTTVCTSHKSATAPWQQRFLATASSTLIVAVCKTHQGQYFVSSRAMNKARMMIRGSSKISRQFWSVYLKISGRPRGFLQDTEPAVAAEVLQGEDGDVYSANQAIAAVNFVRHCPRQNQRNIKALQPWAPSGNFQRGRQINDQSTDSLSRHTRRRFSCQTWKMNKQGVQADYSKNKAQSAAGYNASGQTPIGRETMPGQIFVQRKGQIYQPVKPKKKKNNQKQVHLVTDCYHNSIFYPFKIWLFYGLPQKFLKKTAWTFPKITYFLYEYFYLKQQTTFNERDKHPACSNQRTKTHEIRRDSSELNSRFAYFRLHW